MHIKAICNNVRDVSGADRAHQVVSCLQPITMHPHAAAALCSMQ